MSAAVVARARTLGRRLASHLDDPEAFHRALAQALDAVDGPDRPVALTVRGRSAGVAAADRRRFLAAIALELGGPLAAASPAVAVYLADRLARADAADVRLFALVLLRRSLSADPERSWQLLRRLAARATDLEAVDALAGLFAEGILGEPYRWAELELLVYSDAPWERCLVGLTLARLPSLVTPRSVGVVSGSRGLAMLEALMGDADEAVQASLGRALRAWRAVDRAATADFLRREAALALATGDGARARVIRAALGHPDAEPTLAAELRSALAGVRRRRGAPDTSQARAAAAALRAGTPGLADAPARSEPPFAS